MLMGVVRVVEGTPVFEPSVQRIPLTKGELWEISEYMQELC